MGKWSRVEALCFSITLSSGRTSAKVCLTVVAPAVVDPVAGFRDHTPGTCDGEGVDGSCQDLTRVPDH